MKERRQEPPLTRDTVADVVIVGGGLTGLTLANLLAEAGLEVVLLERHRLGSGTTGSTTAHVTALPDISLDTLVRRVGMDGAEAVIDSLKRAMTWIEHRARRASDRCGFVRVPAHRFAETDGSRARALRREAELGVRLGLRAELAKESPLPFATAAALTVPDQALFDADAYLSLLADDASDSGVRIHEETPVVEARAAEVRTAAGHVVTAGVVVEATHVPLGTMPSLQMRLSPRTSYVLSVRLREALAPGLYWDVEEPYHYLRPRSHSDGRTAWIGGEDHGTGRDAHPERRYAALERWIRERFYVEAVEARWCHELFESADGLPYIGLVPGSHRHFVATGYAGVGITFGTVAAITIRDEICGGGSTWASLYRPSRLALVASMPQMVAEGSRVAGRFVVDRLRLPAGAGAAAALGREEGVIARVGGRRAALYRDGEGALHAFSPRCTHMGCLVGWNASEKTWDCPCHGGRFRATGEVAYGPPVEPLRPLTVTDAAEEP